MYIYIAQSREHLYCAQGSSARIKCSSGMEYSGLVTFRLRVRISPRPFASNLEQVAYVLCAQANSASYPQWNGKSIVATVHVKAWCGWLGWWYVCMLHPGCSCSLSQAMV